MRRHALRRDRRRLTALLVVALLAGCQEGGVVPQQRVPGGDAARGKDALVSYGCGSCHRIPGVPAATGLVGPPLDDFASRSYVAGRLHNEPAQLVAWIRNPQAIDSATAMPNLGVTERNARDIAAYLYTLGADRLGPAHLIPARTIPGH